MKNSANTSGNLWKPKLKIIRKRKITVKLQRTTSVHHHADFKAKPSLLLSFEQLKFFNGSLYRDAVSVASHSPLLGCFKFRGGGSFKILRGAPLIDCLFPLLSTFLSLLNPRGPCPTLTPLLPAPV